MQTGNSSNTIQTFRKVAREISEKDKLISQTNVAVVDVTITLQGDYDRPRLKYAVYIMQLCNYIYYTLLGLRIHSKNSIFFVYKQYVFLLTDCSYFFLFWKVIFVFLYMFNL